MNILTLRIKKKYLLDILNGSKLIEYRSYKSFYFSRFDNKTYDYIKLYYSKTSYIFKILKVEIIKTPDELKSFLITDYCYAIHLDNHPINLN